MHRLLERHNRYTGCGEKTWADTIQSDGRMSLDLPTLLRKIQGVGEGDEIPRCAAGHEGRYGWADNRKISHQKAVVLLR